MVYVLELFQAKTSPFRKARIPAVNGTIFISVELSINVTFIMISPILLRSFPLSSWDTYNLLDLDLLIIA